MARRRAEQRVDGLRKAVSKFERTAGGGARKGGGGIRLTINDDGPGDTKGVDRVFVGLGAVIDAFPQVLRDDALPVIRQEHARVFRTEGVSGRGRWAGLASSTLRDRRRKGYPPGPILLRDGELRRHVTGTPAKITTKGRDAELRIAPDREVNGVPRYRALARGYPEGGLPARPMVALGPAAARRVTSSISRGLRRRASAHGL